MAQWIVLLLLLCLGATFAVSQSVEDDANLSTVMLWIHKHFSFV